MGKVHKIKRAFKKIIDSGELKKIAKWHSHAYTIGATYVHIGKREDGSFYMLGMGQGGSYKKLIDKLEKDYLVGVVLND